MSRTDKMGNWVKTFAINPHVLSLLLHFIYFCVSVCVCAHACAGVATETSGDH